MTRRVVAAIDIGASGGRVMAGIIDASRVTLDPMHRFPNAVVELDSHQLRKVQIGGAVRFSVDHLREFVNAQARE